MEKLTLEHIAPYLPYGLQMFNEKSGRIINTAGAYKLLHLEIVDDKGQDYSLEIWPLKPLLIPLSELTTWMELSSVGEHETIPIYELFKDEQLLDLWQEHDLFLDQKMPNILIEKAKENHWTWDYCKWELLFKWHFDVFGLIEKGLAINKLILK